MTAPLVLPLCRQRSRERRQKRKETLALEFREALGSMITAMKAGSSADNAVRETCREMAFLYGKGSGIYREFYLMQQGLDSHVPLEQLMTEFGERSSIPDIREFAQTFAIAKRNGGSMTEIMARTIQLLQDRIAVEKEISVLISARKLEQRIMIMVPFLIVLYLGAASSLPLVVPDYGYPGVRRGQNTLSGRQKGRTPPTGSGQTRKAERLPRVLVRTGRQGAARWFQSGQEGRTQCVGSIQDRKAGTAHGF